jgi:asperthecin polyketide synthase
MAPIEEKNMYAGDVYVLQDGVIVAMLEEMKFRRVPRLLMNQFFSPSGATSSKATAPTSVAERKVPVAVPRSKAAEAVSVPVMEPVPAAKAVEPTVPPPKKESASATSGSPIITDCLKILARESGLDVSELVDSATFVELGVDSLMSLVLSEKFKAELGIEVKSSVFIECPNIGELKAWLDQ